MRGMTYTPRERPQRADPRGCEDDAIRNVLELAAARPNEVPDFPPFFATRVVAAAREEGARRPMQFVASVAWHTLPAFAALLVVLSLWAGFEIGRDADAQEDVAIVVLQSRDVGPDAPLATLLLSGGAENPTQGGPR